MVDLRHHVITDWVAREVYKVVYDSETMAVDVAGTEQRRAAERRARLARGKSWDEFHSEWDEKQPPAKALKYYGTWPDAKKNREVIRI